MIKEAIMRKSHVKVKFLIINLFFVNFLFAATLSPVDFNSAIETAISNDDSFYLMDLRDSKEYAEAHLASAINWNPESEFFEDHLKVINKDVALFLYIDSNSNIDSISQVVTDLGFNNLNALEGGFEAWQSSSLEVQIGPEIIIYPTPELADDGVMIYFDIVNNTGAAKKFILARKESTISPSDGIYSFCDDEKCYPPIDEITLPSIKDGDTLRLDAKLTLGSDSVSQFLIDFEIKSGDFSSHNTIVYPFGLDETPVLNAFSQSNNSYITNFTLFLNLQEDVVAAELVQIKANGKMKTMWVKNLSVGSYQFPIERFDGIWAIKVNNIISVISK